MKRRWSWKGGVVIAGLFLGLLSGPASADIYRYVDPEGTVHYTNVPTHTRYQVYIREAVPVRKHSSDSYDRYIAEAVHKYDVPFSLIKAIIKVESDFDHHAVSHAGARGLMQIMPQTGQDLQLGDPFDPRENILAGTRYFRSLLDRFNGSVRLALAAYNAGPERVGPLRDIPRIAETRRYVEKVLEHYLSY
jgi:soluble lytic murein transglycosylase-like protein